MLMLSVVASLVVGLAEPDLEENVETPLASEPEEMQPREMDCTYGADREDYNYCLAKCHGDDSHYDAVGHTVRDTRKNRDKCNKEARRFCNDYGMTLEYWCWGQDAWED